MLTFNDGILANLSGFLELFVRKIICSCGLILVAETGSYNLIQIKEITQWFSCLLKSNLLESNKIYYNIISVCSGYRQTTPSVAGEVFLKNIHARQKRTVEIYSSGGP